MSTDNNIDTIVPKNDTSLLGNTDFASIKASVTIPDPPAPVMDPAPEEPPAPEDLPLGDVSRETPVVTDNGATSKKKAAPKPKTAAPAASAPADPTPAESVAAEPLSKKQLDYYAELMKDDDGDTTVSPAAPASPADLPSGQIPKEYLDAMEDSKKFQRVMTNPVYKALQAFFEAGKTDLNEFVQILGVRDVRKMTPEELYRTKFENNKNFTPQDIEEAMEEFNELPAWKKKELTAPIYENLLKSSDEKLGAFTVETQEQVVANQRIMQEAATRDVGKLEKWLNDNTNEYYNGMKVTPGIAEMIKEGVMKNARFDPESSSYNIEQQIEKEIWLNPKLRKKLLRDNIELARVAGYDQAMKDRVRINRNETASGGATPNPGKDVTKAIQGMGVVRNTAPITPGTN